MAAASAKPAQVSPEEVARFSALAARWWDERGPMRPLHAMNGLRTGWIAERLRRTRGDHATLLDIGCGGGLAAEALAAAGFRVTGMDASEEAIRVAADHAATAGLDIEYRAGLAEDAIAAGLRFDAVTALEIIEHVPDPAQFMRDLAALLHPGGLVFVSTLNRTMRSLAVAKIGAEYVARLLPAGTHDWRKFLSPNELAALGRAAGLRLTDLSGMMLDPMTQRWIAGSDTGINYIAAFQA